ncbi:RimK family alpha-L-glutamate ligase [Streptomyces sp. NPDC058583]|uniref:ATP-grasp domain-containing protein n=1 Tax=unclassified Streptomyces TaxID=2593676 RepID=UPI003653C7DC
MRRILALPAMALAGGFARMVESRARPMERARPRPEVKRDLLVINGEVFQPGYAEAELDLNGIKTFFCEIEDIAFSVETGCTRVYETVGGRDLADFGLIQVASYPRPTATMLSSISVYLQHKNRFPINAGAISAPTKLYQLMVLAQNDLPVPPTRYLHQRLLKNSFTELADQLGIPFVLKAMNSSGGRLNYLIRTETDILRCTLDPAHTKVQFLAQQYIENNGVFRILILGGEAPIIMHRCNTDGTHLANTEQGGHATLFEPETFDSDVIDMAAAATKLMGCDVAGVNVVQDRLTRRWHLLEVSSSPAIGSGAFAAEKTRAYSAYLRSKIGPDAAP